MTTSVFCVHRSRVASTHPLSFLSRKCRQPIMSQRTANRSVPVGARSKTAKVSKKCPASVSNRRPATLLAIVYSDYVIIADRLSANPERLAHMHCKRPREAGLKGVDSNQFQTAGAFGCSAVTIAELVASIPTSRVDIIRQPMRLHAGAIELCVSLTSTCRRAQPWTALWFQWSSRWRSRKTERCATWTTFRGRSSHGPAQIREQTPTG